MTTAETNARSGAAKSPQNTVEDRPGGAVPSWVPRLLVISTLFVVLLTACWVGAFRTPSPHGVPVGVVAGAHLPQSSAVSVTSHMAGTGQGTPVEQKRISVEQNGTPVIQNESVILNGAQRAQSKHLHFNAAIPSTAPLPLDDQHPHGGQGCQAAGHHTVTAFVTGL